jgi:ABC-2 type transport system permease protein
MLWYKAWLDTRLRFFIGLALLTFAAAGVVLSHPRAMQTLQSLGDGSGGIGITGSGPLGARVVEALALARDYRGYIWSQWFHQEAPQLWCLFAIVLGSGGIVSQAARGGGLFTLSLPVSRQRLVLTRAGMALGELSVLALVPALTLSLVSPAVGQGYGVGDALIHGVCLFLGGTVFYAIPFLISSLTEHVWVPPLAMIATAVVITTLRAFNPGITQLTLAPIVSAESYFRGGGLPWPGLLIAAGVSTLFIYVAVRNVARRDF